MKLGMNLVRIFQIVDLSVLMWDRTGRLCRQAQGLGSVQF